jgi:hypothetical protein
MGVARWRLMVEPQTRMEYLALLSWLLLAGLGAGLARFVLIAPEVGLAAARRVQGRRGMRPVHRARRARAARPDRMGCGAARHHTLRDQRELVGAGRPVAVRATGPPVGNPNG